MLAKRRYELAGAGSESWSIGLDASARVFVNEAMVKGTDGSITMLSQCQVFAVQVSTGGVGEFAVLQSLAGL